MPSISSESTWFLGQPRVVKWTFITGAYDPTGPPAPSTSRPPPFHPPRAPAPPSRVRRAGGRARTRCDCRSAGPGPRRSGSRPGTFLDVAGLSRYLVAYAAGSSRILGAPGGAGRPGHRGPGGGSRPRAGAFRSDAGGGPGSRDRPDPERRPRSARAALVPARRAGARGADRLASATAGPGRDARRAPLRLRVRERAALGAPRVRSETAGRVYARCGVRPSGGRPGGRSRPRFGHAPRRRPGGGRVTDFHADPLPQPRPGARASLRDPVAHRGFPRPARSVRRGREWEIPVGAVPILAPGEGSVRAQRAVVVACDADRPVLPAPRGAGHRSHPGAVRGDQRGGAAAAGAPHPARHARRRRAPARSGARPDAPA